MYDVKYLAKKHLRTTIAQISYLLICFKITYDVIRLRMVDIITLRKKCPYSEFFWSVFYRSRTEYGDLFRKSPYSFRMRKKGPEKLQIRTVFVQCKVKTKLTPDKPIDDR